MDILTSNLFTGDRQHATKQSWMKNTLPTDDDRHERSHRRSGTRLAWCLAGLALLGLFAPVGRAVEAPVQWGLGLTRNMVSLETNLPESFDPATGRNVKWSAPLGTQTHSSPTIAGGRVLIGTNNGRPRDERHQGDRGVLMCFDERDGKFLWQLVVPKRGPTVFWDWPNAGICSTPTVEGRRVYVVSNKGEVMCLDLDGLANGNDGPFLDEANHANATNAPAAPLGEKDADILWLYDLTKECGVRQHDSAHASIMVHGPYLYVNTSNGVDDSHKRIDAPNAPSLVVLDKITGRLVAQDNERIGPRIFHSTWSSPAMGQIQGQPAVIFCGGDGVVYGFEPLDFKAGQGTAPAFLKRLFRFDCDPSGPKENVHQYNSNRQVSPSNIKSMPVFCDGRIFVTVGGDLWWGKNEAWLKCIDTSAGGDATATAQRWSYPLVKHSISTPAVAGGLVFAADCTRTVHCVDAQTGKPYWTHEARGDFWASPYVADGKVYLGSRKGEFLVFAAAREKKILAQFDLDSPVSSTVAAANGVLYVATQKTLFAIGK